MGNKILEEVKLFIGLGSSDKDELLLCIIRNNSRILNNSIGAKEVPAELVHIVTELSIARYNKIGSEGITSESIDGTSYTYSQDILGPYKKELDLWIKNNSTNSKANVRARII